MNDKKLNININVLPEKYRGTVIKFKHLVVVLGTCCAVAIILLFYQIVLDASSATDFLKVENDLINKRFELKQAELREKTTMENAIREFNLIDDKKAILIEDMEAVVAAAAVAGVEVPDIQYTSTKITVKCPTDPFKQSTGAYSGMNEAFEKFEAELIKYTRFLSASHDAIPYPPAQTVTVTININPKA